MKKNEPVNPIVPETGTRRLSPSKGRTVMNNRSASILIVCLIFLSGFLQAQPAISISSDQGTESSVELKSSRISSAIHSAVIRFTNTGTEELLLDDPLIRKPFRIMEKIENPILPGETVSYTVVANNNMTGVFSGELRLYSNIPGNTLISIGLTAKLDGGRPPLSKGLPPANDNFANAQDIAVNGGSPAAMGSSVDATSEPGEPQHFDPNSTGRSAWFRWTSPGNGPVTVDTIGSGFDTVMAVYSGSGFGTLTQLASADEGTGGSGPTQLVFNATVTQTYYIAIDSFGTGAGGDYVLNLVAPDPVLVECETLDVQILSPVQNQRVANTRINVQGGINEIDTRVLDIMLVLDSSSSLMDTDPMDFRLQAAENLLSSVPSGIDFRIGIVDFDSEAFLVSPLTSNVNQLRTLLEDFDQGGSTNIEAGLNTAIDELNQNGVPDSSKFLVLFSDGFQDMGTDALSVAESSPYSISTLFLGDADSEGAELLEDIALVSGGTFDQVTDPSQLPELFTSVGASDDIDRIEVVSDADPEFLAIIPRSEIVLGTWTALNVPVRNSEGIQTRITATLFSNAIIPCQTVSTVICVGGAQQGPPTTPGLNRVLCAVPSPVSYDPDGGIVLYVYTWTTDGNDQPIVTGPTQKPFDMVFDGDPGVTLDRGETWTVEVVTIDDEGQTSNPITGRYVIGGDGFIIFEGWTVN